MKLHATLDMHHPGKPVEDVIAWLQTMRESGFSEGALVKVGKTTGQKYVLIMDEEKGLGGLTPEPKPPVETNRPAAPMWPEA